VGLRIGTLGGTTIDVEVSFLFLCALFVLRDLNGPNPAGAVLWIPVILVSLLAHELAHAAAIGILGFGPSRVVLAGMGGVTINERKARPWQDLLISLAGPIASFGVAAIVFGSGQRNQFLSMLLQANVLWGIFNLMPVPPLDGGHALRHFLRIFLSEGTAFALSTWIGVVAGVAFAVAAITRGEIYIALLMAYFVFINLRQWQAVRNAMPPRDGG
jgi:Zn-dependent protease